MTTTTNAAPAGEHDLVLHDGPGELVRLMAPFARDGAAAGEELVVVGEPDFVTAMLSMLPGVPVLEVRAEPQAERRPARDLHRFQQLLTPRDRAASRVRVVNQMPTMTADRWPEWRRYEAAVDVVLTRHRVWGTCGYDVRSLGPGMLADLRASHPAVRSAAGHHPSPEYDQDAPSTRRYLDVPPHPVEGTPPTLVLREPTAAAARRAVRDLAVRCALPPTVQESVVLAASEAVTNGSLHGRPPVLLRAWAHQAGRLTVAVSDTGPGPHPLVGMVPGVPRALSGHGMWITHLLLGDVHHRTTGDGYTITFSADARTTLPRDGAP